MSCSSYKNVRHDQRRSKQQVHPKEVSSWRKNYNQNTSEVYFPVIKTIVGKVDLENVKPQRAGIILYTIIRDRIYFGLGSDTRSGDLTDFGGHIHYNEYGDSDVICGAIREFNEETLGIFQPFTPEAIALCFTIYDNKNLIIFAYVDISPKKICDRFNYELKRCISEEPEVSKIVWLPSERFRYYIIENKALFTRVRNFLFKAGDFLHML